MQHTNQRTQVRQHSYLTYQVTYLVSSNMEFRIKTTNRIKRIKYTTDKKGWSVIAAFATFSGPLSQGWLDPIKHD